jgi:cadmium resistance transport/sequestration family protein
MEILLTSVLAFISTNIDDIFILTLFYGNRKYKHREIVAGQYLGIIALIAVSLIGALAGLLIEPAYIGLLGLLPIYLGLKEIMELTQNKQENQETSIEGGGQRKTNVLSVAGVTFANGGDNIGIYIPLFATLNWPNKVAMVTVFLTMTLLLCLAAKYLAKHPYVAKKVEKYGHKVTPFVLILLGIYILYESGTFQLLPIW